MNPLETELIKRSMSAPSVGPHFSERRIETPIKALRAKMFSFRANGTHGPHIQLLPKIKL